MRFEDPQQIVTKQSVDPIEAYENWREVQTVAELESIRNSPNAIHMESLVIRERILSINNPELPHPIVFRGAVFADDARFDRCISLWLHALRLRQRMQLTVSKDLLRFAQVFSQVGYKSTNEMRFCLKPIYLTMFQGVACWARIVF